MRSSLALVLASLCASVSAQTCPRPPVPGSGFGVAPEPTSTVTYTDGYVTEANLLLPVGTPPGCGWPLVVFVHRLGASRFDEFLGLQQRIASHGYAVWAYDVRGQGSGLLQPANAALPGRGTTLWGPAERFDFAEQVQFVASQPQWQGVVDTTRLAVVGSSQGGAHAWSAAAFSGQQLTVPNDPARGAIQCPVVGCVVVCDYVAEPTQDWLREGMLWSSWFVNQITDGVQHETLLGYALDQGFWDAAATAFRAQDAQPLLSQWEAEGRHLGPALQQSTVPVLYSHAYHDLIDSPLLGLSALRTMAGPTRALCSTIGHNTPLNVHEQQGRDQMILRWLDRWLWSEPNEVELEPKVVLAELPLASADRLDLQHLWSHTFVDDPLQPAAATRFFLYDDGSMQPVEPAAALAPAAIHHSIHDPGFTAAHYLADFANQDLATVLNACPLSELVYASAPLPEEGELGGAARVHLAVTPSAARWMCAVLLTVQPPAGDEVMLTSWAAARATSAPGTPEAVDVTLAPVAARLPAGTVVRVRLRNHWLRMAPQVEALETAPLFDPFDLQIAHGDQTTGSWLDLPLVPPRPKLVCDTEYLETGVLAPVTLRLRAGAARAGLPYFLTGSASGQVPRAHYLNDDIPIEVDWLTGMLTVSWLLPQFTGFVGDLGVDGETSAVMDLSACAPLDPALAGLRMTFAAFVWDLPTPTGAATNPVDVFLR